MAHVLNHRRQESLDVLFKLNDIAKAHKASFVPCLKKSAILTALLLFAVIYFRAEPEENDPPFSQLYLVSLIASPFVCGAIFFIFCQCSHRKRK